MSGQDAMHRAQQSFREDRIAAMDPHLRSAEAFERARLAYALVGFRTAYTMNAGAAVALPTFAEILNLSPGTSISYAVTFFVIGITVTFIANFFAYYSAQNQAMASIVLAEIWEAIIANEHGRLHPKEISTERYARHERLGKRSGSQALVAATLIATAILCFVIGILIASGMVQTIMRWMNCFLA